MPAEGWAIELKGDRIDVDDAREALRSPFDPLVEDYADGTGNKFTLVRTAAWATLTDAADVTRDAERMIERQWCGAAHPRGREASHRWRGF
jgi:hypothetical protein